MNEEEKQAIEYIKNCLDNEYNFKNATRQKDKDAYNVILSLINKQQKEIEKLKDELKEEIAFNKASLETLKECVHKDKIKEKIEEITKEYYKLFEEKRSLDFMNINGHRYNAMKLVLEELLGE